MKNALIIILNFCMLSAFADSSDGVSEKDFNHIAEIISRIYSPKFKATKENFDVIASWVSPQKNASAEMDEEGRLITLHGGAARLKGMSFDVFLIIACHEVGHHLGGAPYKPVTGSRLSWMSSTEGQADYFATSKCYKEVLQKNPEILKREMKFDLPEETYKLCQKQYREKQDYAICLRGAQASLDYGRINAVNNFSDEKIEVSLTKVMSWEKNIFSHAHPQCRTETLYQGILCNKDIRTPFSFSDENQGACTPQNFDRIGLRPKCWYVSQ